MEPLFLCGHRKSGTTMLLNLLNGHSNLLTYPEDLCLLYGYYPKHIESISNELELKDRLDSVVFRMLEKKVDKRGYKDKFSVEEFSKRFYANASNLDYRNIKAILDTLFYSYEEYMGGLDQKFSVWKETSIEIYANQLFSMYPNAKFLHLIRDPRDNFAAIKSGVASYYSNLGETENSSLASVLHRVEIGFKLARINIEKYGCDRYKVVRFEDLVKNPVNVLNGICEFLGIEYSDVLLKPTSFGVSQAGNSHGGEKMFSISDRNVGRWKERITEDEQKVIEFFLEQEMKNWDYPIEFTEAELTDSVSEYYKWSNYKYFYKDSFKGV
ncbi:sulfotransferase family protein [Litoribrevibacter euphylliae]|uniref:Sulfotransferase family protein n=1 Tax=Litoribrevibacter euphylliae TaxID=1834034 RepID=A0ABV7H9A6_9GAMM